jgi:colicin import membrane protein
LPKAWANNLKSVFSWREPGTLVSALGHGLVLAVGLFSFTAAKPFSPAQEAVAVDVVSDQQFSEMMRGDKESKVVAKTPERRVERVAETKEDKDPGQEKRDVPAPPSRPRPSPSPSPSPNPSRRLRRSNSPPLFHQRAHPNSASHRRCRHPLRAPRRRTRKMKRPNCFAA